MTERTYAKFDDEGRLIVNTERWAAIATESAKWRGRYKALAEHVPPESLVIEFGCGNMVLKELLPAGCQYQPSDLVPRSPDCLVLDLNAPLPASLPSRYDVAVFAGVLEYVADVRQVLHWVTSLAGSVLFSYATTEDFSDLKRRHAIYGWFSHCSHGDLLQMASDDGIRVEQIGRWNSQNLYRASR